jgi:hypothetical protein
MNFLLSRLLMLLVIITFSVLSHSAFVFAQLKQDAFTPITAADSAQIYLEAETRDRIILPNKDTLLIRKGNGELWFGAWGGGSFGTNTGTLRLERNRFGITPRPVDFAGGFLSGYAYGFMAEWLPKFEQYGVQFVGYTQQFF